MITFVTEKNLKVDFYGLLDIELIITAILHISLYMSICRTSKVCPHVRTLFFRGTANIENFLKYSKRQTLFFLSRYSNNSGLQKKKNAINIAPMYSYVFGIAEFDSEVRIGPSGHNFFLTSKTYFTAFIFFQAQSCSKSFEKIYKSVFYYHTLVEIKINK